jgi:hypothetical protein
MNLFALGVLRLVLLPNGLSSVRLRPSWPTRSSFLRSVAMVLRISRSL